MNGGAIENCSADNDDGGGISIWGGVTTMNGGAVRNCIGNNGGAVIVAGADGIAGAFRMRGGSIENCTGQTAGAVAVWEAGTFSMEGGLISGNTATGTGGAVTVKVAEAYVQENFIMSGGIIRDNTGNGQIGNDTAGSYTNTGCFDAYWSSWDGTPAQYVIDLNGDGIKGSDDVSGTGLGGGTLGETDSGAGLNIGDAEIYNMLWPAATNYGGGGGGNKAQTVNTAVYAGEDARAFIAKHPGGGW
jgi:hypothetical protein